MLPSRKREGPGVGLRDNAAFKGQTRSALCSPLSYPPSYGRERPRPCIANINYIQKGRR